MKKRWMTLLLLLACLCLLAGCACKHEWTEADCTTPKTCGKCSAVEGEALGHDWVQEGCSATCSRCGAVTVDQHTWAEATCVSPKICTVCGLVESNTLAEHQWVAATATNPKTCSVCGEESGLSLNEETEQRYAQTLESVHTLAKEGKYREAIRLADVTWKESARTEFHTAAAEYRLVFGKRAASVLAAGENNSAVLNKDGTVTVVGRNDNGELAAGSWTDIVAVSLGDKHIVGLKTDGTVVAAGSNASARCNVVKWENVVAISAGNSHTVGLLADGTLLATGYDEQGQCQMDVLMAAAGDKRIVSLAAGYYHTAALLEDGTVVACGDTRYKACNVERWTDIAAVFAGNRYTAGLKTDGTVVVTGQNVDGWNVSEWTDIVDLAAGDSWLMGIRADGTVVCAGIEGEYLQEEHRQIQNWKNITYVAVGYDHTVAMDAEGDIYCAGVNNFGQCDLQTAVAAASSADEAVVPVDHIVFDHFMDYWDEYANVLGMSADGKPVWIYMTDHMGEYQDHMRVEDIGQIGDLYFIREDQCVIALDCATGQPVWQHKAVEGEFEKRTTDSDGNTHIVGYTHDIYVTADGKAVCANEDGKCKQHNSLKPSKPGKTVSKVRLDYFLEGEPGERGNFVGLDKNGNAVWIYRTSQNDVPQCSTIMEIGKYGNTYYILDCGKVTALDYKTGEVLWQNEDAHASGISSFIDTNGTIYLCGYLGPDLLVVDAKGNIVKMIEMFDENYYCPIAIEKKSGKIHITFEGGPEYDVYEHFLITVNPKDFSCKIVGGIDPY